MTILIAVPSSITMISHFVSDLINLITFTGTKYAVGYFNVQGALLPISRWNCVKFAQRHKFDKIVFIDSDMRFPRDSVTRLLESDKEIIGVNAAVKNENRNVLEKDINGADIIGSDQRWIEVQKVGMALTLIDMKVFDHIQKPYFYIDYGEDNNGNLCHWGEDVTFCEEAKTAGYKIWIDNHLSKEIGHMGIHTYYTVK